MNNTEFTPSPWLVIGEIGDEYEIADYYGTLIARIGVVDDTANAHLIAAAPDLYDALEGCLDSLGDEFILPRDCVRQARTALMKARGEVI